MGQGWENLENIYTDFIAVNLQNNAFTYIKFMSLGIKVLFLKMGIIPFEVCLKFITHY